uniref:U6 snRNA-associated Sm-like protein LSm4 n=1 Tax=Urocitellus parryii TaxID=9999 RepID=A0A8D2I6R3_UROPR
MLPLSLLKTAQNHPMLVELKNGETYNGHLVSCDNWMNINLREVICTSRDGDKFWRMPECYIRGSTIKYLRIPDEIIDMVKEEVVAKGRGRGGLQQQKQQKGRGMGGAGRGRLPAPLSALTWGCQGLPTVGTSTWCLSCPVLTFLTGVIMGLLPHRELGQDRVAARALPGLVCAAADGASVATGPATCQGLLLAVSLGTVCQGTAVVGRPGSRSSPIRCLGPAISEWQMHWA